MPFEQSFPAKIRVFGRNFGSGGSWAAAAAACGEQALLKMRIAGDNRPVASSAGPWPPPVPQLLFCTHV